MIYFLEIVRAVQKSCEEWDDIKVLDARGTGYGLIALEGNELNQGDSITSLTVVEKHMYTAVAPDPDIIIRTSGVDPTTQFSSMEKYVFPFIFIYPLYFGQKLVFGICFGKFWTSKEPSKEPSSPWRKDRRLYKLHRSTEIDLLDLSAVGLVP
ncbi:hypothetical protein Acr_13g0009730 [Actinidia rufa]|uniref:Uncharacterized protein n=1 Tax=Actinidia rufa TaxID=165716 RepID=A0A7J0FLX6_9ERIC|nr:hypothetical protein Acr_13g0009730 [Actinidia rufa]